MTTAVDWRQLIKSNRQKTYVVIAVFFLIYTAVGLLGDFLLFVTTDPASYALDQVGLSALTQDHPLRATASLGDLVGTFFSLCTTGERFPFITLFMFAASALWFFMGIAMGNRMVLIGTKYKEITPETKEPELKRLYNIVEEMVIAANMKMPHVYVIQAPSLNAFASGLSQASAMIAIHAPMLQALSRDELQAVVAHELTHIRNEDIRLTFFVSILSYMICFFLDLIIYLFNRRDERNKATFYFILIIFLVRMVMPLLTLLLMLFLSRTREYMADAGAVELMRDNQPLGRALIKIHTPANAQAKQKEGSEESKHEDFRQQFYLYEGGGHNFFSTHPSLQERLKAIGYTI